MKVEVKLIDTTMEESALINVHSLSENISMAIELLENNRLRILKC